MSYDDFVKKYSGEFVDQDGYYGAQCMDLVQFYARELGISKFSGNAADVANQEPSGWKKVSSPQRGDVVVYERSAGNQYFGHIAIIDTPPNITFGQNYPTGTNSHIQKVTDKVIALLRPQTLEGANMPRIEEEKRLTNLFNQSNFKVAQLAYRLYEGREATDQEARQWIATHPVDVIVEGIRKGRKPLTEGEAQEKLNRIKKELS